MRATSTKNIRMHKAVTRYVLYAGMLIYKIKAVVQPPKKR